MDAIKSMMILNPRVEIYILDADGKILGYFLNPHETVYRTHVELRPVLAFIESGGMRLAEGQDPRSRTRSKRFSAAPLDHGGREGLRLHHPRRGAVRFLAAHDPQQLLPAGRRRRVRPRRRSPRSCVGLALFFLLTRRLRHSAKRCADSSAATSPGGPRRAGRRAGRPRPRVQRHGEHHRRRRGEAAPCRAHAAELIGNISHDLRSPLASIHGYLETALLKDAELDPGERRRFLEISLRSAESLRGLVEELFDLVRLETGQVQPRRESFSLAELAQDVVLKLAPRRRRPGCGLGAGRAGCPPSSGDIGMIERVLTNLIENAVRYTPRAARSGSSFGRTGGRSASRLPTRAAGIAPEDLPRVFERFYRADPSRDRSTEGAGLGLAIARQIVELHGGTLEVESRPGQGAVFSFRLR